MTTLFQPRVFEGAGINKFGEASREENHLDHAWSKSNGNDRGLDSTCRSLCTLRISTPSREPPVEFLHIVTSSGHDCASTTQRDTVCRQEVTRMDTTNSTGLNEQHCFQSVTSQQAYLSVAR